MFEASKPLASCTLSRPETRPFAGCFLLRPGEDAEAMLFGEDVAFGGVFRRETRAETNERRDKKRNAVIGD